MNIIVNKKYVYDNGFDCYLYTKRRYFSFNFMFNKVDIDILFGFCFYKFDLGFGTNKSKQKIYFICG